MDRIVSPQVLRLLKQKKCKIDIMQLTRLNEDQLYSDIETLIKTGQPVLKTDLSTINEIDFNAFSQCINEQNVDILNVNENMLKQIQRNYNNSTNHQIDSGFTRLVLVYYEVRLHLSILNVPYVDCDGNILMKAENLIVEERQGTLNTTFETDREYPPFGRNNNYAYVQTQHFVDLFFGECVNCDRDYHHDSDSSELKYAPVGCEPIEYEPMEFNGFDTLESEDGSERENNSDLSDDENYEGNESEYTIDDGKDNGENNDQNEEGNNIEVSSDNSGDGSDDDSQEISNSDESNIDVEDGSHTRIKRRKLN